MMRLAGCSFFGLILKAVKDGYSKKNSYGSASIKESEVLVRLIRVFYPEYPDHDDNTQSNYTSVYKSGKNVTGDILPFTNSRLTGAFDVLVTENYPEALKRMTDFVNTTLNIDSDTICIWLIKALYELLENDETTDGDFFHVTMDGQLMRKDTILNQKQVYFPSFLLGIWHFIVCNRPDNSVGKSTIEAWYAKASKEIKAKKVFISTIGIESKYDIQLTGKQKGLPYPTEIQSPSYSFDKAKRLDVVPDLQEIDISSFVIVQPETNHKEQYNSDSREKPTTQQILKTDKVIQQQANKIYNIEHIEYFNA